MLILANGEKYNVLLEDGWKIIEMWECENWIEKKGVMMRSEEEIRKGLIRVGEFLKFCEEHEFTDAWIYFRGIMCAFKWVLEEEWSKEIER